MTDQQQSMTAMLMVLLSHMDNHHGNTYGLLLLHWMKYVQMLLYVPVRDQTKTFTGVIPPFIGQDYFCETGSRDLFQYVFYADDPLWNGQGCGSTSTCCSFNNPPWFCKQLLQPTTDDIELRLCGDESIGNEDIPLEIVEMYIK